MKTGLFITFEGPEGAGKTTQVAKLAEGLRAEGYEVVTTREPGATKAGQVLREALLKQEGLTPKAQALIVTADRAQHMAEVVEPALARGAIVISDRHYDSTLAHQGFGADVNLDSLMGMTYFAVGSRKPDLTFLLDLPVEVGLERRRAAGGINLFDEKDLSYQRRVREGYLQLADREPERFVIIDATCPEDIVADAIEVVTDSHMLFIDTYLPVNLGACDDEIEPSDLTDPVEELVSTLASVRAGLHSYVANLSDVTDPADRAGYGVALGLRQIDQWLQQIDNALNDLEAGESGESGEDDCECDEQERAACEANWQQVEEHAKQLSALEAVLEDLAGSAKPPLCDIDGTPASMCMIDICRTQGTCIRTVPMRSEELACDQCAPCPAQNPDLHLMDGTEHLVAKSSDENGCVPVVEADEAYAAAERHLHALGIDIARSEEFLGVVILRPLS